MDSRRLRHEIGRFDGALPLAEASTPPASWYTEQAVAALERRAVFARRWQLVARAEQLAAPGSFVASCQAGRPVVVVRGEDGVLRALVNVCRHKATQVASGAGVAGELVCPYHGWVYGLDGRLLRAPEIGGIRGFDRAAQRLPSLRVETWGPFVFACGDDATPPLAEHVRELDAGLQRTGWAALRWHSQRRYEVACNWKVFCDNYLDGGYHIAHMHPTLDAQLDMASYRTELLEHASIQSSGAASGSDGRIDYDAGERIGGGTLYAFLYPNLMLNRYGPVLDTNLVLPLGPDRCEVLFDFFFDADALQGPAGEAFIERSLAQSEQTQQEDMAISASVQVGLASGAYDVGRYAPAKEAAVLHFHRKLSADLVDGLA